MNQTYISVDIEASGSPRNSGCPVKSSLLSIGAVVVGRTDQQFYRELKPIHPISGDHYNPVAMSYGARNLRCLDDLAHDPRYQAQNPLFEPSLVLRALQERGEDPKKTMIDFKNWIGSVSAGNQPHLITDIQWFDGAAIDHYFALANEQNPFGFKGTNIDVLYRGIRGDLNANLRDLDLKMDEAQAHNALYDAFFQAQLTEAVFKLLGDKNPLQEVKAT